MAEEEFKLELTNLYQQHKDVVTETDGGQDGWVTIQYEKAFGLMNGAWNPGLAQDYLAQLSAQLDFQSDGL